MRALAVWAIGLAAWPWLGGCGTTRTAVREGGPLGASAATASGGAGARARGEPRPPDDSPLGQRVRDLARQLEGRGVQLQGVSSRGFITRSVEVTTPFEVPAGRCVSIVALASSGVRDLDAHLFAPNGDVLAEDVEPDPHPTVQLCAAEARRVYHVVEAYEGQGAYVVASFVTDRAGLDAVARAMGGRPGTAVGSGAQASEAEQRLQELREGIGRRGFTPSGDAARASFSVSGAMRFPIPVTPDRCYTLAALAEGGITNADLSVFDPGGDELARDVGPERDAFAQLCPAAAGTLSVEVRANAGPGTVILQAFGAEAASLGGPNTLWLGERMAWGASALPLPEATEQVNQALASLGYTPVGVPVSRAFAPGEAREERVAIPAGRCTAFAAIAGRGLGRLRVEAFDAQGELVARGVPRGPGTVGVVCPAASEELRVVLAAEVGSGQATLRSFAGGPIPAWASGLDRVALSEAIAGAWRASDGGWQAQGAPERVRLGARAQRVREHDRAAGRCVRWMVSAGRGLPWVALSLRGQDGGTLGESSGEGTAVITRCGPNPEHLRLELRTDPPEAAETDAVVVRWERPDTTPGR